MNKSMRFLLVLILAIIGQVSMWGANSSTPTDVGNYINLNNGTYSGKKCPLQMQPPKVVTKWVTSRTAAGAAMTST